MDLKSTKDKTFDRWRAMVRERQRYRDDWIELSDFVLGARGRFMPDQSERQDQDKHRRNPRLYNEVAKQSAHILMSGMMAGITSPARPWFKLAPPDPEMEEHPPIKLWLDEVQRILLAVYARSNFYNAMANVYLELGTFGTTAMGCYESFDSVARFEPYTIGSFALAMDGERDVDTMYREYEITVGQAGKRFDITKFDRATQNLWDRGDYEEKVKILHAIEPNTGRKLDSPLAKNMPWRSVYYQVGGTGHEPISESGFRDKPFMAPRWSVVADDTYATSYPGIDSLASNKSLQVDELDRAIAVEKMHNPPLVGDASLAQAGTDLIAGGITYMPNMAAMGKPGLSPVYNVNPRIAELDAGIQIKEQRIQRFFYADLFLMLTDIDRAQITATEIAERKEEKMLMLGPVLEHLNNELLDPVVDRTFSIAQRAGIIPPPPEELVDADLRVEYISVLAQAQKAVSTSSIEATMAFAGNLAAVWPEARHKVDPMQAIDDYARAKGASPKIVRGDKDAMAAADQEAQRAAMAQMAQQAPGVARAVKDVSETEPAADGLVPQMADALRQARQ